MKIIRTDGNIRGGLRVVSKFAIIPKMIYTACKGTKWVFLKYYYELQINSWHGKGWLLQEESVDKTEWDFKWSEAYLNVWKEKPQPQKLKHTTVIPPR